MKIFFWIGIFLSLIIRIYFILHGSEVADVNALHEMGDLTLKGVNPYLALSYNAYPPLAIYLEVLTIKLSQFSHIPFFILTKIWPNLADILITLILYKFLVKSGIKKSSIYIWCLLFFLNPISIIISGAHGQIDSIPTFLVTLSIFLVTFYFRKPWIFLSAFFLGIAIAIKPNPLILLPFFLTFRKTNLKTTLIFLLIALIPVTVFFLPFLKDDSSYILNKIFNYSGSNDFGIPAILRGWYFQKTADYNFIFPDQIIKTTKIFFLGILLFTVFIYRNSQKIVEGCLIAYLLFITFYFGISAQYLSWILPFAILERNKMVIPYSFAATLALLGFYLFINPTILLSQFANIPPYQSQFMLVYVIGNLILWIISFVWLIKLFVPKI